MQCITSVGEYTRGSHFVKSYIWPIVSKQSVSRTVSNQLIGREWYGDSFIIRFSVWKQWNTALRTVVSTWRPVEICVRDSHTASGSESYAALKPWSCSISLLQNNSSGLRHEHTAAHLHLQLLVGRDPQHWHDGLEILVVDYRAETNCPSVRLKPTSEIWRLYWIVLAIQPSIIPISETITRSVIPCRSAQ